jgi:proteasome beta subunit
VRAMAKMVANFLYQRKMAPLYANVEIAGVDENGPQVFTMDAIGSLMEEDYGVSGSSATFAVGILEAEYNSKMTVADGKALIQKTIRNAVKRDAMTGNNIDLMTITKDDVEEFHIPIEELSS